MSLARYLLIASLGVALFGGSNAQAAFSFMIAGPANAVPASYNVASQSGAVITGTAPNQSLDISEELFYSYKINGTGPLYTVGLTQGSFVDSTSSTVPGNYFADLSSGFTIINEGGQAISSLTITISENAYNLGTSYFFSASYTAITSGATTFGYSATATGSNTINFGTGLTTGTGAIVQLSNPVLGPVTTITQTITISNLAVGDSFSFVGSATVATPAPATALAAIAGLPVFGFVGAIRRRFKGNATA